MFRFEIASFDRKIGQIADAVELHERDNNYGLELSINIEHLLEIKGFDRRFVS